MFSLMILALAAPDAAPPPDPAIARMVALYDEVCLKTFPYDDQVDALMTAKGAKALTAEQAKVTLRDDPGRGWSIEDGDKAIQVMIELPPYHACSVRRMTAGGLTDAAAYRTAIDRFKQTRPGFTTVAPIEMDREDLHIRASGEQRNLSGGSAETLLVYEQAVTDAKRRAAGETAINLRFVHQLVTPH